VLWLLLRLLQLLLARVPLNFPLTLRLMMLLLLFLLLQLLCRSCYWCCWYCWR